MSIGVFLINLGDESPKKSAQRGKVGPEQRDPLHGANSQERPRAQATVACRPQGHGISLSAVHHLD